MPPFSYRIYIVNTYISSLDTKQDTNLVQK